MRAESPPTASGLGSTRPMCWHAPSGSTWSGAGWKPTIDNYLGRVTKPRILDAVREAKGESSAQLIDHLKRSDMAKEAERLLDGSGWLPEPLRLIDVTSEPAEQEGEAGLCLNSFPMMRSASLQPTKIGRNSLMLPNSIVSRHGSGRPRW